MTLDASELFVGQTGSLYIAPVGTVFPTDIDTAIDTADWTELGYVDTDGVQFTLPTPITWIRGWQSRHPLRGIRGDLEDVIGFTLQQWNADSVPLALNGATIEANGTGWRVTPPSEEFINEVAFLVEGRDGDEIVRFGAARAINQAATTFTWSRTAESKLAVELQILASVEDQDWFMDFTSEAMAVGS